MPELLFRSGCLQTSFAHASSEFRISVVKALSHLTCIKHVREYGTHEDDQDYHQETLEKDQRWNQMLQTHRD